MLEKECQHFDLDDGICKDCGIVIENCEYHSNSYSEFKFRHNILTKKELLLLKEIKKITEALSISSYEKPILKLALSHEIKFKISPTDRIIICTYFLLRTNGFPITINDFVKYTDSKKNRLLKIYRETFKFEQQSVFYLRRVYERVFNEIKSNSSFNKITFNDFINYKTKLINSDPRILCMALLFNSKSNRSPSFFKNLTESEKLKIKHMKKSISKLKNNETGVL